MIQQLDYLINSIISNLSLSSKAQEEFLSSLLKSWHLVQGRYNHRNISRYAPFHESTLGRWSKKEFTFSKLHKTCLELWQAEAGIVSKSELEANLILGIDCSYVSKSGKATYGLDFFWDGCTSKERQGLELSGAALISPKTKEAILVDICQTPSGLSKQEGDLEDYTRIDHYLSHIDRVLKRYDWLRYVVLDGYYAKMKVFTYFDTLNSTRLGKELEELKKEFEQMEQIDSLKPDLSTKNTKKTEEKAKKTKVHIITKLRKDANIKFLLDRTKHPDAHGNRKYSCKFNAKKPLSQLEEWTEDGILVDSGGKVKVYSSIVYHMRLKKKLKVVMCWHKKLKKHILLATTDDSLSGMEIVEKYKARFQIEFLFRDAKQYAGLKDAQVRSKEKLAFHFNIVFAMVNLVRLAAKALGETKYIFSNTKRCGYNQIVLGQFIANSGIDMTLEKNRTAYENAIRFGMMGT